MLGEEHEYREQITALSKVLELLSTEFSEKERREELTVMALLIQSEAYKNLELKQEAKDCLERALREAKTQYHEASVRKQMKELFGEDGAKTEEEVP